jgi:hypothetical protein
VPEQAANHQQGHEASIASERALETGNAQYCYTVVKTDQVDFLFLLLLDLKSSEIQTKNEIKYLFAHLKCGAMQMNLGLKRFLEKEAQCECLGPPFLGAF